MGVVQLRSATRSARERVYGASLTGSTPGTVFDAPAAFELGTEAVFVNGQRQLDGVCYVASESGGLGTGYDRVTFTSTIIASDRLWIDYVPA